MNISLCIDVGGSNSNRSTTKWPIGGLINVYTAFKNVNVVLAWLCERNSPNYHVHVTTCLKCIAVRGCPSKCLIKSQNKCVGSSNKMNCWRFVKMLKRSLRTAIYTCNTFEKRVFFLSAHPLWWLFFFVGGFFSSCCYCCCCCCCSSTFIKR